MPLTYRNQPIKEIRKANKITIKPNIMVIDRTKRTGKSNTTVDFETLNVMVWNGFSWLKIASCGTRL
jgi:hypothetical protein